MYCTLLLQQPIVVTTNAALNNIFIMFLQAFGAIYLGYFYCFINLYLLMNNPMSPTVFSY